ncbi:hypothetical protein Zmor_008758 [Zophobas morio]|uniref:Uncharacterized protein n=1 Tax=Zophobas morio TaxID=2755281 RepID=A0AA38M0P5_9CUCU|nr:hypothetical protein Zmor_008758 [Zophobas morio]
MISNYRLKKGDVKDGEMVYRENKMRYNFYNAIDRYIIGDNKEDDNKLLKLINDLLSSQDEINKVVSDEAFELLVDKKYNNNENLKYIQKYYAEPGAEQMFVSNPDNYINLIIAANKKDQRQRMIYKPLHEKFTEFMNLVRSVYTPTIDDLFNNFELLSKVKNILASKNSSNLIDKFKKINYEFNDNYETQAEINRNKKFADLVFENELINVIGITTTAPQQLIVGGKKKMLFTEYQVDYEIIDEVSKSSTAELINASILSGRILYCGDYRQIQPQDNLSTHALYKE